MGAGDDGANQADSGNLGDPSPFCAVVCLFRAATSSTAALHFETFLNPMPADTPVNTPAVKNVTIPPI